MSPEKGQYAVWFQFLLVRLKEGCSSLGLIGIGISIPTGTIKSKQTNYPCRLRNYISIPTGTIKSRFNVGDKVVLKSISIPTGTIKSSCYLWRR